MTRIEREDLGVAPSRDLHRGAMHGPTPASIPGGQVITTQGLVALVQRRDVSYAVIDVLGQSEQLPNAISGGWLSQPGSFDDPVQTQATQWLAQLSQGRKDTPLVFYCLSRECWMSYNAALRAIRAGHTNVLWYRGGLEAWKAAGLPTQGATGAPPPGPQALQAAPDRGSTNAAAGRGNTGNPAGVPPNFVPVQAMPRANASAPPASLSIGRGRFFTFAVPPAGVSARKANTR